MLQAFSLHLGSDSKIIIFSPHKLVYDGWLLLELFCQSAWDTVTLVVVLEVATRGSVLTREAVTLVHVELTVVPVIAGQTVAPVLACPVQARPSVEAGLAGALVDVHVAFLSRPALLTLALPVIDQVGAETFLATRILK